MGLFSSKPLHSVLVDKGEKGRHIVIDHIDGNKLNNQKSNLRICTHQENMRNRKTPKKRSEVAKSKYKGVVWCPLAKKWRAYIRSDKNKRENLGYFTSEDAAANCYNYWAKIYHGEFAKLNDCPFMPIDEWMADKSGVNQTSNYRGVSYSRSEGKWLSQICHNYKRIVIGRYDTEIEAAMAYNEKALELKGKKAKLNIIS